jgi:Fe2+ transport system protein FeoA
MALSAVQEGKLIRVESIAAGRHMAARLAAVGLIRGTPLRIVRNTRHGSVIVAVNGTRLVLGRGMADKLRVTE